jgi:hypothetical protein
MLELIQTFLFFSLTLGPRMRNKEGTLWGLTSFSMLEIQGDLYTFGGETFGRSGKSSSILKLSCYNYVCSWSQFLYWPKIVEKRSHLVAIPVPDSFCTPLF